jgi:hypothetical protein
VTDPSVAHPPKWERSAAWATADSANPAKDDTIVARTASTAVAFRT